MVNGTLIDERQRLWSYGRGRDYREGDSVPVGVVRLLSVTPSAGSPMATTLTAKW